MDAALDYALLSFPFTVNRMSLKRVEQRIANIAKGKFAEWLFRHYAILQGVHADFEAGATPYYLPDHFDFSLRGFACDLKNNYIYATRDALLPASYLTLPALVPNRYEGDQWSKRLSAEGPEGLPRAFVFTFIRMADKPGKSGLFDFRITASAAAYFAQLAARYRDVVLQSAPFSPEPYLEALRSKGMRPVVCFSDSPEMAITAVATADHWKYFADAGGGQDFGYAHYTGRWYDAGEEGRLRFCGGILHTKIRNAVCPVGFLPSFARWSSVK